eukprot:7207229-Prorocentrum_lima.AAC.1
MGQAGAWCKGLGRLCMASIRWSWRARLATLASTGSSSSEDPNWEAWCTTEATSFPSSARA